MFILMRERVNMCWLVDVIVFGHQRSETPRNKKYQVLVPQATLFLYSAFMVVPYPLSYLAYNQYNLVFKITLMADKRVSHFTSSCYCPFLSFPCQKC